MEFEIPIVITLIGKFLNNKFTYFVNDVLSVVSWKKDLQVFYSHGDFPLKNSYFCTFLLLPSLVSIFFVWMLDMLRIC